MRIDPSASQPVGPREISAEKTAEVTTSASQAMIDQALGDSENFQNAYLSQIQSAMTQYAHAQGPAQLKAALQNLEQVLNNAHVNLRRDYSQLMTNVLEQMPGEQGIQDACSRMYGMDYYLSKAIVAINNGLQTGNYPSYNSLQGMIGSPQSSPKGGSVWGNMNLIITDLGGTPGQITPIQGQTYPVYSPPSGPVDPTPAQNAVNWFGNRFIQQITNALNQYTTDFNNPSHTAGQIQGDLAAIQATLVDAFGNLTGGSSGNGLIDQLESWLNGYAIQGGASIPDCTTLLRRIIDTMGTIQTAIATNSTPDPATLMNEIGTQQNAPSGSIWDALNQILADVTI